MGRPALIVSQSGQLTSGLVTIVDAQEYAPVSTFVTDRAESGQYYLSPETVEEIAQHADRKDTEPLIIVDGMPHPGQLIDLRTQLQSSAVVDKRWIVWNRLAEAAKIPYVHRGSSTFDRPSIDGLLNKLDDVRSDLGDSTNIGSE